MVYLIAFVIGGSVLCLYLYGSKTLFAFAVAHGLIETEEVPKGSPMPAPSATTPTITPENVESHVSKWVNGFKGGTAEVVSDPKDYFSYRLVFDYDGVVIGVSRRKEYDRFITLHATIGVTGSYETMYGT